MSEKFVMSFSGGKDSILALYRMIRKGHTPIALVTTLKDDEDKSWTHGLTLNLLKQVSESLDIPLIPIKCDVSEYEKKFEEALIDAKEQGAKYCAFGDIDIEGHRTWDTDRCKNAGLEAVFPLWQESREKLVYEFIDSGFTTIIKTINLQYLGEEFVGKKLDRELIEEIKKTDADVCGENGEYHTFVIDGPIFKEKIEFNNKGTVVHNGYAHLHIS